MGAGVEVPDQIGAGAWGQLHHHAIGAAAIEHEAARSSADLQLNAIRVTEISQFGDQIDGFFVV